MGFYPFEVTAPHLVYTLLGGFTVIFGMFSAFIKEKLYLGEAPIATIFGIILGPHVSGLIDPYKWGGEHDEVRDEITLELTRVVIAISVFAAGVELPKAYMLRHWRSMTVLLLPAMLWGWFVSALFMWALFPKLKFLSCLLIAAAVTPTDPILAQSVIGGKFADKHVPAHVRHVLSAESGSNDGAAFPFMYIALYLTLDASPGHAIGEWFYATIAYEIILGTLLGGLLGFSVRKVMQFAERRNYIDRQSFVAQYVSLALLSTGGTVLLGSDDLLSAFACGCAFAWDGYFNQQTEDAVFSNVVDLLFNCAAFIYIGALLPFPSFNDHSIGLDWWRLVVLAICILVARRLPAILAMYKLMPDIKTFREACFVGWFGPMGVGAVFISTLARHELPEGDPDADTEQVDYVRAVISPIVLFIVLSSVLTHGLSIPFFSLGRRVHSLTYTWSRQPSMRDAPAWTTHTRTVRPGEAILINRDEEDGEGGDVGLHRTRTGDGGILMEKTSQFDSGSSESRPGSGSGSGSGSDGLVRDAEGNVVDEKQDAGARRRNVYAYDAERGDPEEMEQDEHGVHGERAGRDDARLEKSGGRRTPPVAEYREGDDLIIERENRETGELDVQVRKDHFRKDKKKLVHSFSHPESLENNRGVLATIMPTLERWASAASQSTIGRGSRPATPLPQHRDHRSLDAATAQAQQEHAVRQPGEPADDDAADTDSGNALHRPGSGAVPVPIPNIRVDSPDHEDHDERAGSKPSLRTRLFGRKASNSGSSVNASEVSRTRSRDSTGGGIPMTQRSSASASLQRPHINTANSSSSAASASASAGSGSGSGYRTAQSTLSPIAASPLDLTRTSSNSLSLNKTSRIIRFAPELAPSSDTVPGPVGAPNTGTSTPQDGEEGRKNYGNEQSGFKKTPGLGLFRTGSIKQEGEED